VLRMLCGRDVRAPSRREERLYGKRPIDRMTAIPYPFLRN